MKAPLLPLGLVGVLALGVAGLWFALDGDASLADGPNGEAAPPTEVAAVANGATLTDADAPDAFAEPELLAAEEQREGLALAESAATPAEQAPPGVPLRGRVIDATTRDPLPEFFLHVTDPDGRSAGVTTDASGAFETAEFPAGGELTFTPADRRENKQLGTAVVLPRPAFDIELVVPVEWGPTYELALTPDAALETTAFEARLTVKNAEQRDLPTQFEPVRAGARPWVRFPPRKDAVRAAQLEIRSLDGVWRGREKVSALNGSTAASVKLEAYAALVGSVRGPDGAALGDVDLRLRLADQGTGKSPPDISARSDADGNFRFTFLRPGAATVHARSLRHRSESFPVELESQRTARLDVQLAELPVQGSVLGEIASETGTFADACSVTLQSMIENYPGGNPLKPLRLKPEWRSVEGRLVAAFEFERLPAGEYQLRVTSESGYYEIKPSSLKLAPSTERSRFVVQDGAGSADLILREFDADHGGELDGARVAMIVSGLNPRSQYFESGTPFADNFPLDRPLRWRVDKRGYQPAFGDETSFVNVIGAAGERQRVARVDLKPGWGDVYRFTRENSERPLAGVRLLLDGEEVGVSDKDGVLVALCDHKPKRAQALHKNWKAADKIPLREPARERYEKHVRVRMVPGKGK